MATQRWPTAWLLTDERLGQDLDGAMARAARAGAGILVRHHRSDAQLRRRLAERVLHLGAPLGIARDTRLATEVGALFVHNPARDSGALPFSLSVHDEAQAQVAAERGTAMVFISPVHATRSHAGAPVLGEQGALALAAAAGRCAIALGGMDRARGAILMEKGFHGWAGIDCWMHG